MELRVIPFQFGVLLTAVLKDSSGAPLSGRTIRFYGSSGSGWTLLGSSATDDTGTATYSASVYNYYYAEFPGDDDYELSTSSVVSYGAPSPPPSPSPSPLSGECCDFGDFGCWFFRQGKCVVVFGKMVDGLLLSILLIAIAVLLIVVLVR